VVVLAAAVLLGHGNNLTLAPTTTLKHLTVKVVDSFSALSMPKRQLQQLQLLLVLLLLQLPLM
jgi:hypothetical protein